MRLESFRADVERDTDLADYPHASSVRANVLVYRAATMAATEAAERRDLQAELIRALADGPGVVVICSTPTTSTTRASPEVTARTP